MSMPIGIFATAYTADGTQYSNCGQTPQVHDYIESVIPPPVVGPPPDNGQWYEVHTTGSRCIVTARESVVVGGEHCRFSYWLFHDQHGKIECWPYRAIPFFQGESGFVGLLFGKVLSMQKRWPGKTDPSKELEQMERELLTLLKEAKPGELVEALHSR